MPALLAPLTPPRGGQAGEGGQGGSEVRSVMCGAPVSFGYATWRRDADLAPSGKIHARDFDDVGEGVIPASAGEVRRVDVF
jgi:hypothetical protein